MSEIIDFKHPENSTFVGWVYKKNVITKNYSCKIYAILLKSEERVLVVELIGDKDNAVILNADGSEFKRILNPDLQALCFGDVYYVNDELTLISRRRDASMLAVVIDEEGAVVRTYETR